MSLGEYIGAGSDVTKGLWHLNGNSNDSSGNGNHGTDTNISYSNDYGRFGQGASFNGSSSSITLPNGVCIGGNNDQTQSIWFKLGNNTQLDKELTNITDGASHITYDFNYNSGTFRLRRIRQGVAVQQITMSLTDTNNYHNAIFTYNSGVMSLYMDAVLIGSNTYTGNGTTESTHCHIGSNNGVSQYFTGYIDEVIIENRAWTAVEIQKYYTMAKGRFEI